MPHSVAENQSRESAQNFTPLQIPAQNRKEKQAVLEEDVGTLVVKRLNADTRN
jgi:hypothetical protein